MIDNKFVNMKQPLESLTLKLTPGSYGSNVQYYKYHYTDTKGLLKDMTFEISKNNHGTQYITMGVPGILIYNSDDTYSLNGVAVSWFNFSNFYNMKTSSSSGSSSEMFVEYNDKYIISYINNKVWNSQNRFIYYIDLKS